MVDREVLTLRRAEDDKLREHVDRRHRSMMASQDDVAEWFEIAGLCMPQRSRQLVERHKAKHRSASAQATLYDSYPIRSFETCANGMLSGLSSRSTSWFKPTLEDADLMDFYPVRLWLDEVGKLMGAAFAMSNFYEAALSCYLEMAAFGTAANIMQGHDTLLSVNHPLTIGEYGLSVGADNRPDGLSRSFTFDARQMVEAFVADRGDVRTLDWSRVSHRVKEAWDKGNYDSTFTVCQLIEANPAYVPGKIGRIGMPWRSIKWEDACDDKKRFLAIQGYHDQPFMAPRWETLGGDVWGTGRGKKALADMRVLQLTAKRGGQADDMAVLPPTWGPPTLGRISMKPGAHTTVAAADMSAGIKPIYQIDPRIQQNLEVKQERGRRDIDLMTYADVFAAFSNREGVQPLNIEELTRRHEEKLAQLGPVTDRANGEFLQVAFDRMFGILARGGMLPPAPAEIEDMEIRVDFTSVLTQAQRLIGISQTERSVGFVGNLAAAFPEAADNLDTDAIVKDYWERSGATAAGLRDPKARDEMRAQRAQAAQAEKMAAMAPAMQQGADAARLLSEADTGNGSMLERLVG